MNNFNLDSIKLKKKSLWKLKKIILKNFYKKLKGNKWKKSHNELNVSQALYFKIKLNIYKIKMESFFTEWFEYN